MRDHWQIALTAFLCGAYLGLVFAEWEAWNEHDNRTKIGSGDVDDRESATGPTATGDAAG